MELQAACTCTHTMCTHHECIRSSSARYNYLRLHGPFIASCIIHTLIFLALAYTASQSISQDYLSVGDTQAPSEAKVIMTSSPEEPAVTTQEITQAETPAQPAAPALPAASLISEEEQQAAPEETTSEEISVQESAQEEPTQQEEIRPEEINVPVQQAIQTPRGYSRWRRDKPEAKESRETSQRPADNIQANKSYTGAAKFVEKFDTIGRAQRRAQAAFPSHSAQARAQAQVNEIMDARFRHKIALALHAASLENKVPFPSYRSLRKKIDIRIIINKAGEVMSVEFAQATGYPELDAYIAGLIKKVKRFPLPQKWGSGEFFMITIPTEVHCDSRTDSLGFTYHGGGDTFT